jgi:hypothetical protein
MRRGSIARWILFALPVLIILMATTVIPWSSGWHAQVSAHHLEQIWTEYSQIIDRIYSFLDKWARFFTPMATIAGMIYGIYHKWQFSKSRMHLHIQEFLKRDDERLIPTRKLLDAIVTRPGPAQEFASPIFSIQKLAPALKRMRWGRIEQADSGLDTELSKIQQQIEQWGNLQYNYNRHKAYAYLLKADLSR